MPAEDAATAQAGVGVVADDIADGNSAKCADRNARRAAHAGAQPQKQRSVGAVAHGDAGKGNGFDHCAIGAFNGEAFAAIEDAIRDGNVLEAAVGLGSQLDASVEFLRKIWFDFGLLGLVRWPSLPGSVEHGADKIRAGDIAVGDGHIFRGARITQSERAFGADGIVPGRIDAAIRYTDIFAAIDIDAVAIGVDQQIVYGQIVNACGENGEVSALKHGKIPQYYVVAIFQAQSLISHRRVFLPEDVHWRRGLGPCPRSGRCP